MTPVPGGSINTLGCPTNSDPGDTIYTYDANDNLLTTKDANNHVSKTFTYDKNNLQLTEKDALNNTTTFVYDGAGNRNKRTDAKGAITTYGYDLINRHKTTTYPQGSVTYNYDDADRLTSMVDGTGTTTYVYDELDRPSSVTFPGSRVVGYLYDAAGNRSRITYPDGKQVNYTFDDANRMETVTDWGNEVTTYDYDDAGRLTSTTLPNGVIESRGYNAADQLTNIGAVKGQTSLTSFSYTLDDAGIRLAVQTPAGSESYTYDNLYRLTGVSYPDGVNQTYTYDFVGNRLTKVEGASTTTYAYDDADRMTFAGGVTYSYDNNGNQTGRGSDTFGWDYEDRLTSATVGGTAATFAYRGDDLRHSKTVGGNTTTYTWDVASDLPLVLQEGSTSYVYGLGLISQVSGTNQTWFLADALGSTAALTDTQGDITATYKYDAFGAIRANTGPGSTDFRFAGQEADSTLGYQYLRARYYDPAIGRFIGKDPVQGLLALPATQNPFAYAFNSPVNASDPTGEFAQAAAAGFCAASFFGCVLLGGAVAIGIAAAPPSAKAQIAQVVTQALNDMGSFLNESWQDLCTWRGVVFSKGKDGSTPTQRLKRDHLTDKDLDAAKRELEGEVVKRKSSGEPYDHVGEVRRAQRGLMKRIGVLKKQLSNPNLDEASRTAAEKELSDASRALDRSEHFVPRLP